MRLKNTVIATAFSILFLYGILIASAFYFFDVISFKAAFSDYRILYAIWISISAASLATVFAILIAVPAAFALSRYDFRLKSWIDLILELPMIISPAALGAVILIFFQTPLGLAIRDNVIDVVYAFSGIVLAQFITVLGIATRMIKAVFDEVPVRYENIARTMGAGPGKAFFQIALPLAKNGIFSAVVLTWAKAIGEFGATITVAGSMSMKTETLPTAIFLTLSTADIKGTVILILILLFISLCLLIATRYFFNNERINGISGKH